jgi:uncharacterized protein (TIGR03085 family)
MSEPIDVHERRQICDLLLLVGPDAPTLCEGWTTADLAAHLFLREHFRRSTNEHIAAEKARGLPVVVARLRGGAPLVPWRLPRLRTILNGMEYFIHHEDVRRANGYGPRTDIPDLDYFSWKMSGFFGRRLARSIRPFGLELIAPDGARRTFGSGAPALLTGRPTELILFLGGRRSAAEVTLGGADDAIAAVEHAHMRL